MRFHFLVYSISKMMQDIIRSNLQYHLLHSVLNIIELDLDKEIIYLLSNKRTELGIGSLSIIN